MTKMSVDATSAQKKMWMQLHCKTGVNMASMQGQMLSWLHGKDN